MNIFTEAAKLEEQNYRLRWRKLLIAEAQPNNPQMLVRADGSIIDTQLVEWTERKVIEEVNFRHCGHDAIIPWTYGS